MVGSAVFVREDALTGAVFVHEDMIRGGMRRAGEDVVLEGRCEGKGEETGEYGLGEPGWEGGREERVGGG